MSGLCKWLFWFVLHIRKSPIADSKTRGEAVVPFRGLPAMTVVSAFQTLCMIWNSSIYLLDTVMERRMQDVARIFREGHLTTGGKSRWTGKTLLVSITVLRGQGDGDIISQPDQIGEIHPMTASDKANYVNLFTAQVYSNWHFAIAFPMAIFSLFLYLLT